MISALMKLPDGREIRVVKAAAACGFALATLAARSPAQQAAASDAAGESPYRAPARLPVRITTFTVEPTTIQPGETVTLSWAAENPTSITIDPLGRVAPRGQRTLTPG